MLNEEQILEAVYALSEGERYDLFNLLRHHFCLCCGSDDPRCRCWDDS